MSYQFSTLAERPDLLDQLAELDAAVWPKFMMQDPAEQTHWDTLHERYPQFQVILHDDNFEVLAAGHTVPVRWDGTLGDLPEGWSAALSGAFDGSDSCAPPNALSALSVVVHPDYQGLGLSREVIFEMKKVAEEAGFANLIVPVRPTLKSQYPLIPIERYVQWAREDGLPFDPWLRTHSRMGAQLMRVAPRSMVICGSIAEWQEWTDMEFPESGHYVVPGALQPVAIDLEADRGVYEEPNVWMHYTLASARRARSLDMQPSSRQQRGLATVQMLNAGRGAA